MSVRMPSRLPLAMMTGMPSDATWAAMRFFEAMPPRPSDDLAVEMQAEMSRPVSMTGMTRDVGLAGSPS